MHKYQMINICNIYWCNIHWCYFYTRRLRVFIKTWYAKKAEKQNTLKTRWEQDYVLDQAPEVSLFEEYLEMGKLVEYFQICI